MPSRAFPCRNMASAARLVANHSRLRLNVNSMVKRMHTDCDSNLRPPTFTRQGVLSPIRTAVKAPVTGFMSLEDLQSATRELEEKLKEEKAIEMGTDVVALKTRLASVEKEMVEVKSEQKGLGNALMGVQRELGVHDSTLGRLFELVRALEGVAFEYRTSSTAIIVRRQLDDARFVLADAFMMVFPHAFPRNDVLNPYDVKKRTVEWSTFRQLLMRHIFAHLRNRGPADRPVWMQTHSLFGDCDSSVVLSDAATSIDPSRPSSFDVPNHLLFGAPVRTLFTTFGADGSSVAYKDKTFFGHLQLYIPIFIWAYNILKAEILKNDVTITKMKHRLSKHNHLLRSTDGTESSRVAPIEELRIEDITTHFVEGTAIDLRVKQNWKAFFAKAGSVQRDDAGSSEGFTEDVIETAQTDRETQVGSMTENEDSPRPPSTTTSVPSSIREMDVTSSKYKTGIAEVLKTQIADTENKIRLSSSRRKHLVAKYMTITRCLAILLDTKLLNHAVFGDVFVRLVTNYFVHKHNVESPLVEDALGRVQELLDKYRSLKECEVEEIRGLEAEVLAELGLGNNGDREKARGNKGAGSKDRPKENYALHDADIVNDARRLSNMLHSSRQGYFEKTNEKNDTSMEKMIDKFLATKETDPSEDPWGRQVTDIQILVEWLNSFLR